MGKKTRGEAFFSFYGQSSFLTSSSSVFPSSREAPVQPTDCFLNQVRPSLFPLCSRARSHSCWGDSGGVHTLLSAIHSAQGRVLSVFVGKKTSTSTAMNLCHSQILRAKPTQVCVDHPKLHQNSLQGWIPPLEPACCEAASAAEKSPFTNTRLPLELLRRRHCETLATRFL